MLRALPLSSVGELTQEILKGLYTGMNTKGLLLAGGKGSRLGPLTEGTSKHLLPIYDKPLIYYPLTTLMAAGARQILVLVEATSKESYVRLLGDGSQWGLEIEFAVQENPNGIPEALIIAEDFLKQDRCTMALGDTIFFGSDFGVIGKLADSNSGALITRFQVEDPRRFGVVDVDEADQILSVVEKPQHPRSNFAVPGIYFFDETASSRAATLSHSDRGELEIVDVLASYLQDRQLRSIVLPEGTRWFDIASAEDLRDASEFVKTMQDHTGKVVGSPELWALKLGLISESQFLALASDQSSDYGRLLEGSIETGDFLA